jgi:S-adenosylmethionine:tRNA ribosyltransferase-isomerase
MLTDALDYHLPPALIATHPAKPRDAARLMVIHRDSNSIEHRRVADLPTLGVFAKDDLIVVNQSRVLPAAIIATRAATGGRVSGLYLASDDSSHWRVMLESGGRLQVGETLQLDRESQLELVESLGAGQWKARCRSSLGTIALLEEIGQPPLPPYICKARMRLEESAIQPDDRALYNTIYAADPGSVAAPTAGLHFTEHLLNQLQNIGVLKQTMTLHVGLGTFAPIRADNLADHAIHSEAIHLPAETIAAIRRAREIGATITPIGTTTVRGLESLPDPLPDPPTDIVTNTQLFIHSDADFTFRFTDRLLTNFHLPRSSLLALVASLPGVGIDRLLKWYAIAIEHKYRFYSYGDAMLIV